MTGFRGSKRSDLDAGDGGGGRSEAPLDMAIEMATAATSMAAETVGLTISELIMSNKNGKRKRKSAAPEAPSDWRSRLQKTIQQQA
jgi:hypothetical protein